MRMSDDEAHARFQAILSADNGGAPFCPRCESQSLYAYTTRRAWKCRPCQYQFTVTSGKIFASRKLPIRDYLAAIAIFVNVVKGISALQLGRDLDVQYKTAFVMAHKIREAIGANKIEGSLDGVVEIDGAYVGGHAKQENKKADRPDRRLEVPAKRLHAHYEMHGIMALSMRRLPTRRWATRLAGYGRGIGRGRRASPDYSPRLMGMA